MSYTIYTAGEMTEGDNNDVSPDRAPWRRLVDMIILREGLNEIRPAHPIYAGCDHKGISPEWTVDRDMELIRKSDGVLAYLNRTGLYGTVAELMYAYAHNIPIVVVIRDSIISGNTSDEEGISTVYSEIYNTTHCCDCCIQGNEDCTPYWFVLNYISTNRPGHPYTVIARGDDPLDGLTQGIVQLAQIVSTPELLNTKSLTELAAGNAGTPLLCP